MSQNIKRKNVDLSLLKAANLPVFFIVGGPGSGKGTQCDKIVKKYGFSHISSGDLLRNEIKGGTTFGDQLQKIMKSGKLVPLEFVIDLIKEAMVNEIKKGSKGFIIDGYPRDINQGNLFESEIQQSRLVIYFEVSEKTLVNRLLERAKTSGRADDNLETIKKRLETFNNDTTPVVQYYKSKGKLVQIIAEGSVDEIFAEVSKALDASLSTNK